MILARKDSGIHSLADLKGHTFAFVDPSSASGHLFPKAGLEQAGFVPDTLFKRVIFSGSHDASILAVENKKVDAAAVADRIFASAVAKGVVKQDDFEIVWSSKPIPESPMVWRKALDPELKKKSPTHWLRSRTCRGVIRACSMASSLPPMRLMTWCAKPPRCSISICGA